MLPNSALKIANELIRERIFQGTRVSLRIASDSMRPLISSGDHVLVERADQRGPRIGDIVLHQRNGELCVHRLLCKKSIGNEITMITKGDACISQDHPLPIDSLLGKVVFIKKPSRKIDLRSPLWKLASFVLTVFSLIEVAVRKAC